MTHDQLEFYPAMIGRMNVTGLTCEHRYQVDRALHWRGKSSANPRPAEVRAAACWVEIQRRAGRPNLGEAS